MKKFINAFEFDVENLGGEFNDLPSQTVPDQTMSLQELLKRYTRGAEIPTYKSSYQEDDEFSDNPEFEKMDATEKLQYALDLKMAIKRHQNTPPKAMPKQEPAAEPARPPEAPSAPPAEPEKQ